MSKSLAAEFEVIANSLQSGDAANSQLSISALAERIAKEFKVKTDEVAILAVSERWRHIYFLVPEALRDELNKFFFAVAKQRLKTSQNWRRTENLAFQMRSS